MDRQGPPIRPAKGLTRTKHEKDAVTSHCLDKKYEATSYFILYYSKN